MSIAVRAGLANLISGRDTIERELGRGGMATVYLARDLKHRREVALKVLDAEVAAAIAHDRFLREIDIAAHLNHPHIVALFDSGAEGDVLFYVMPRIEGESLRAMLDRRKTLPLDEALRLTREIASALEHAHRRGIVHRDIKPENVLLADGIAVVADFGIGRAMTAAADTGGGPLTQTGLVIGTPHYMSPEQASGDAVDGRSDIYSLACVLFEMLSGRPPFRGTTTMSILAAHMTTPAPDIRSLCPSVPKSVSGEIAKALAKKPDDRHATAVRFAEALTAAASGGLPTISASTTAPPKAPNNLPQQRTRFVGREREIRECSGLLREARITTLTGIGGSGKTRLALAVAQAVANEFPDGIWFVDLSALTDPALLAGSIASAIRLAESPGRDALDVVGEHFATRRALLVLDNCEQLTDATAALVDVLLAKSDALTILATSREGLGVDGERIVAVKPLPLPTASKLDPAEVSDIDSVRLFVDRAVSVSPGFSITSGNADAVAEICRRLDGIPLAIELAAARIKVLSPEEIRARLDDRFRLLSGSSRGVMPRHQTLTATIQWSYDQLPEGERKFFRMFSVFSGGWTLAAAREVAGPDADDFAILETIGHLVDKSLVYVQPSGSVDETRYGVLETVRQYGRDRLLDAGEATAVRLRHLTAFTAMVEASYAERHTREDFWTARLEADHDNLRAALETARETSAEAHLKLAGALAWFWQARSHYVEGREHLAAALARPTSDSNERARALWGMGLVVGWQGDAARSLQYMREAVDMWRSLGNLEEVSLGLEGIGWAQTIGNDYEAGEATFMECLRIQEERNDPVLVNRAKVALAQVEVALWKVAEARALADEVIAFSNAHGDIRNEHSGWHFLADCALVEGNYAESLKLYQKSLSLAKMLEDRLETSAEIQGVGMSLAGLGASEGALRLVSAAKAEWQRIGVDLQIKFWDDLLDRYMGKARYGIDPAAADLAWSEGSGIAFDDAVAMALAAELPS